MRRRLSARLDFTNLFDEAQRSVKPLHVDGLLLFNHENISHEFASGHVFFAEPSYNLGVGLDCYALGH
jgi:hypothetical protein